MSHSVLVTGGAGFIGSHLVEALVERGDRVRVLDDLSSGRLENLAGCTGDVEVIVGDVRDRPLVERCLNGIDAVFHEAAIVSVTRSLDEPELVDGVNVGGSLTVLAAARRLGVGRVVFASSAAVYGDVVALPVREDAPTVPMSPYGVGKLAVEGYAAALAGAGGAVAVCLRYFNVYGPRQDPASEYSGVIARFMGFAGAGRPYVVYGDGRQTRDFVFVGDVVRANLLALDARLDAGAEAGADPGAALVLNIGGGGETSVLDLAAAVETAYRTTGLAGEEPVAARISTASTAAERFEFRPPRTGEIVRSCADIGQAGALLGYIPMTSLSDGLRTTWEWWQQEGSTLGGRRRAGGPEGPT
jgi:UDP-glucose 4-epimerase